MKRISHVFQVGSLFVLAAGLSQAALHAQPWQNPYVRYYNRRRMRSIIPRNDSPTSRPCKPITA